MWSNHTLKHQNYSLKEKCKFNYIVLIHPALCFLWITILGQDCLELPHVEFPLHNLFRNSAVQDDTKQGLRICYFFFPKHSRPIIFLLPPVQQAQECGSKVLDIFASILSYFVPKPISKSSESPYHPHFFTLAFLIVPLLKTCAWYSFRSLLVLPCQGLQFYISLPCSVSIFQELKG